jgi:hypothetical protein
MMNFSYEKTTVSYETGAFSDETDEDRYVQQTDNDGHVERQIGSMSIKLDGHSLVGYRAAVFEQVEC